MTEKVKVLIEIKKGSVEAVYGGDFVEIVIVDHDSIDEPFVQAPEPWTPEATQMWEEATTCLNTLY